MFWGVFGVLLMDSTRWAVPKSSSLFVSVSCFFCTNESACSLQSQSTYLFIKFQVTEMKLSGMKDL